MSTTNLLQETIDFLHKHGKTEANVQWVGSSHFSTSWQHFKAVADFYYDEGHGSHEIALDLLIVGADFWLERQEYDGQEGWEFKTMPTKPALSIDLQNNDLLRTRLW